MSGDVTESILVPFLGAFQASLAVLLTIAAGVIAAQFGLLDIETSKKISSFCVRVSLPALLITNVGSQLHLDTALKYAPILIWSVFYTFASIGIGLFCTKVLKFPDWVAPAMAFNNTTSLPLLLVQSLETTGILDAIDTSPDVIARAKSFFLINAAIGNSLAFALGPKLLRSNGEDASQDQHHEETDDENQLEAQDQDDQESTEQTSLLPRAVVAKGVKAQNKLHRRTQHAWSSLSPTSQTILDFLYCFINAPLLGALAGALIGLVPALHRLFFASPESGGYLNAWLTSAIENVGDLFAVLQIIVVGVKLSEALLQFKHGDESEESRVPWLPFLAVTAVRFVLWPAFSIGLIYVFATKTGALSADAILWFCMMLMPTGPPALSLTALADVSGADDEEKMLIAKFLTISYAISPLICFSVVGALKASESAVSI